MKQTNKGLLPRRWLRQMRTIRNWLEIAETLPVLLDAGLPLSQALQHILDSTRSLHTRSIVMALKETVVNGKALSDVKETVVPELLRLFLVASELSGTFAGSLREWSEVVQQQKDWWKNLWSIAAYPVFLFVSTIILLFFMLANIVPTFENMYRLVDAHPSMLSGVIEYVIRYIAYAALGVTVVGAILASTLACTRRVAPVMYEMVLSRSGLQRVVMLHRTRLFALLLGTLAHAGIPIIDGLVVLQTSTKLWWLNQAIEPCRMRLLEGKPLNEAFSGSWHPLLHTALATAVRTGDIDAALHQAEKTLRNLLLRTVEHWFKVLQPLLIGLAGGLIGCCMLLLFVPMYDVIGKMTGGGY